MDELTREVIRDLEREAAYNEEWAKKLTGRERQQSEQWATEDREAARKFREAEED